MYLLSTFGFESFHFVINFVPHVPNAAVLKNKRGADESVWQAVATVGVPDTYQERADIHCYQLLQKGDMVREYNVQQRYIWQY